MERRPDVGTGGLPTGWGHNYTQPEPQSKEEGHHLLIPRVLVVNGVTVDGNVGQRRKLLVVVLRQKQPKDGRKGTSVLEGRCTGHETPTQDLGHD